MNCRSWPVPGILWLCVLLLSSPTISAEDAAMEAYGGKTLTYIVPNKPGGGYDRYARLVAKHLPRHLPVARINVRNSPGAGGLLSAHQLYHAEPDGLTIAAINAGVLYAQILGRPGLDFDLRELSWIGKSASDYRVLVMGKDSGYQSPADLLTTGRPILIGASGAGSGSYNESRLLIGILQFNAKLIPGFRGDNSQLAIRRGDIDGRIFSYSSVSNFVDAGEGQIVMQVAGAGVLDEAVPQVREFVSGEFDTVVLDTLDAVTDLGRLSAAPPGVSARRLAILRQAYAATLSDPLFLDDAAALRLSISPGTGEFVEDRLNALFAGAQQYKQQLKNLAGGSQ